MKRKLQFLFSPLHQSTSFATAYNLTQYLMDPSGKEPIEGVWKEEAKLGG